MIYRRYYLVTVNTIACCIVGSKLDYCNSLLFNIPASTLQMLQRVQNNLACVVWRVSKFQRPSGDLLHELHWLPIRQRIYCKIATIHLSGTAWATTNLHLINLLVNYISPRTLCSTSQRLLDTLGSRNVTGAKWSAAPVIWNKLPYTVRSAETIGTFRTRLKTQIFPVIAS